MLFKVFPPRKLLASVLLAVSLSGCATLQAPRTPRESIAYVNSQLAAAYQSVADTVQAGTLDKSRGRVFVDKLNEVSRSVDAAEGFLKPCETAKVNCDKLDVSLATAQKILRTVIVELQAREAVK